MLHSGGGSGGVESGIDEWMRRMVISRVIVISHVRIGKRLAARRSVEDIVSDRVPIGRWMWRVCYVDLEKQMR